MPGVSLKRIALLNVSSGYKVLTSVEERVRLRHDPRSWPIFETLISRMTRSILRCCKSNPSVVAV